MTTLTKHTTKNIIRHILYGVDHRLDVLALINEDFLRFSIDFFKKVVFAKSEGQSLADEKDWYKNSLMNENLTLKDIIINSGLNQKTVDNMQEESDRKKTAKEKREIVLSVADENYDSLRHTIEELTSEDDLNLKLKIKFKGKTAELSLNESLIVINTLAVKRAALRGGHWSTTGKSVEKPLMKTLCMLYGVPAENWDDSDTSDGNSLELKREVDFFLIDGKGTRHKCEVKLMGKGNPEGADGPMARSSSAFIASTISDSAKQHLDAKNILWVQLRGQGGLGYKRFRLVLEKLGIPHKKNHTPNLETDLPPILEKVLGKED